MLLEVAITAHVYVSVENGADESARRLVRDHVCNGWLLQNVSGAARDGGHYTIKGLSGEVIEVKPWVGNRRVGQ